MIPDTLKSFRCPKKEKKKDSGTRDFQEQQAPTSMRGRNHQENTITNSMVIQNHPGIFLHT